MIDRRDRAKARTETGSVPEDPTPEGRLRARLLTSVRGAGRYGLFADRIARLFDVPLSVARERLAGLERDAPWQRLGAGVEVLPVEPGPGCRGALTTFVRMVPGAAFPRHVHVDEEIVFVLDGGFHDSLGAVVTRGEELYRPAGSEHGLSVHGDGPCLAATVAFGGIQILGHESRNRARG